MVNRLEREERHRLSACHLFFWVMADLESAINCHLLQRTFSLQRGARLVVWSIVERRQDGLIRGFLVSSRLTVIAGVASLLGGLVLGIARIKARGYVRFLLTAYVEVMRNTPL